MDYTREKICSGKVCYSKRRAWAVKLAAERRRNRRLRIYEHPACGFYHLTSDHG